MSGTGLSPTSAAEPTGRRRAARRSARSVSLGQNRTRCKRQLPRPWNHVTIRPMTVKDVILTIAIMLGVGLVCQLVADFARIPRMLVLLFAGVLLGPSVSDAIDIPLDSMGAQLLLSLG